jgi:hypothetical protein
VASQNNFSEQASTKLKPMKTKTVVLVALAAVLVLTTARAADITPAETKAIAEEAYIYGFPMIAGYKAMYEMAIDKSSSQFKAPFNTIANDSTTATPKDTAVVTPNADTPYSIVWMDLRAEPVVLCVPEIAPPRWYAIQLTDLYTFNYAYVGTITTGNGAGCYMVAGPKWQGEKPANIAKVFRSETEYSLALYRTQLFNAADIENVRKVQARYKVQTLSQFENRAAPPSAPAITFPPMTGDAAFKTDFASYLNFLLQFCPEVPEEKSLRAKFASIGIGPGKKFNFDDLSPEHKAAVGLAIKEGYSKINARRDAIAKTVNGWQVGAAFGDRAFYHGDYLLRAAAALAGLYGNDVAEALYAQGLEDSKGEKFTGTSKYTITFPAGEFPPVNAFWSVTMYGGNHYLVENPINRYLINSPMLPDLKKNADGSLTIYIQNASPGAKLQANWLPAPAGPFFMQMRLYWPKKAAIDGLWKPPQVEKVK